MWDEIFIDLIVEKTGKPRQEAAHEYHTRPDKEDNILLSVDAQVEWLREIGFAHGDCYFRFLELASLGVSSPLKGPHYPCEVMRLSINRHRDRIARVLREQVETNTVSSLASFQAKVTEAFELDRSPEAQQELSALIQELYDEYERTNEFDYDDIVEQSFPGSDPPPPPAPGRPPNA